MAPIRGVTYSFSSEQVQHTVREIKRIGEEITLTDVKTHYQYTIERMQQGWISINGKKRVIETTDDLNNLMSEIAKKLTSLIANVEKAAVQFSKGVDDSAAYTRLGLIVGQHLIKCNPREYANDTFNDYNGFIIVEDYLKEVQEDFKKMPERINSHIKEIYDLVNIRLGMADSNGEIRTAAYDAMKNIEVLVGQASNELCQRIDVILEKQTEDARIGKENGKRYLEEIKVKASL